MAKCDLCGCSCAAPQLVELRPGYQVAGVKDVCPKCEGWANKQLDEIRAQTAPVMRQRIAARVSHNAEPSLWHRITGWLAH